MSDQGAVALTRSLLGFDTVNPPGRERDCARHLGALLEGWGFGVAYHEFAARSKSGYHNNSHCLRGRKRSRVVRTCQPHRPA